ncbi:MULTISPECIES: hypothetical protein [Streptosporangium]|uniref:Uncharacterized protein n=1 Tax=Streptosporangium brasiliense TaxID=47480 RepID=A0ABT9QYL6_9ACTN|nr:hypothetical protein [Streptosporangium brasiliense]MDP9862076.1 hypothetical protein [Streptosporangium brasiliense]
MMRALGWAGVITGTAMTLAGLYGMAVIPTTDLRLPAWAVPLFVVGLLLEIGAATVLFHAYFDRMWERSVQAVPGGGSPGRLLSSIGVLTGEDGLLTGGLPAEADILAMADTGMTVNDSPVAQFRLEVRTGTAEPYVVDHRQTLPGLPAGAVLPGRRVPVRVDPADARRLAIDWAAL